MRASDAPGGGSVLRNTAFLAVSRILDRVSGFAVSLLIAPKLGATGLGTYFAAMAVYGVIAIAGEAGTTNFLVREISRDRSRTASYVVHVTLLAIGLSLALTLAVELAVPFLGYSHELELGVSIICLAILPTVLNSVQEAVFVAYGRVEFEALANVVVASTYIAASALLLAAGHGVPALLRVYVGLEYAVTLVYFVLINRAIARLWVRVRWRLAGRLAVEMRHFTGSSALAALFSRPELVILSLLASERQVGYYGAAVRIAELGLFVPQVFMANVFPLMSRAYEHAEARFRELQEVAVRLMLAFSLPLAALLLATAGDAMTTLYGNRLEPAVEVLRLLAVNVVFYSLISVLWRTLAARGRQSTVLRVQVSIIGLRLGAAAALIVPFAASGAAVATAASSALQAFALARGAARSGAPLHAVRLGWRLAICAALAGALAAAVGARAPLAVELCAGVAAYLVAAFVAGAVPRGDRTRLRALLAARAPEPAQGSSQ